MNKITIWLIGLSIATLAVISCKKKEGPSPQDPENPSNEAAIHVFRPNKVYIGSDSAQPKLWAEYTYDDLGRLKERIVYTENMQPYIDHLKEVRTYSPSLLYIKRTFLNQEDQKYYSAGFDSVLLQNNRIIRTASFYTYQGTAVIGNDTVGIKTRKTYTYREADSLEIEVYRNIAYDEKMETARYRFNKKGQLKEYESTKEGETSPSSFFRVVNYEGINGKFENGTSPFENGVDFVGLPTETIHRIPDPNPYSSTTYMKWKFDQENRPISATYLAKTGSDSTKTYYRFEY